MSIRIDGTNTTANPGITGSDTDTGLQFGTNEVKVVTGGNDRITVDSSGDAKLEHKALFLYNSASTDSRTWMVQNDMHAYGDFAFRRSTTQTGTTFETKILFKDTGGICFNGDTAAANALDDYEDGTYTPTITLGSGSATLNTSFDKLAYTKIGRVVHVQGQIVIGSVSSPGGTTTITLPFNSANLTDRAGYSHQTILSYYNGSGVSNNGVYINRATIDHNQGSFTVRAHTSTSGGEVINTGSYLGAGTDFWVNLTYIAA